MAWVHRFRYDSVCFFEKSRVKTMLIAFCNVAGITHKEFVPLGQTVYAAFNE